MSPDKARVLVVEDDKDYQSFIKEFLEDAGHEVVLTAGNLPDALSAIKRLAELKINVVTIDGNLDEDEYRGYDGRAVLKAVKDSGVDVKTVGMSGNSVQGVDIDLGKANLVEIGKTVTSL